jgi:hypothetical protein
MHHGSRRCFEIHATLRNRGGEGEPPRPEESTTTSTAEGWVATAPGCASADRAFCVSMRLAGFGGAPGAFRGTGCREFRVLGSRVGVLGSWTWNGVGGASAWSSELGRYLVGAHCITLRSGSPQVPCTLPVVLPPAAWDSSDLRPWGCTVATSCTHGTFSTGASSGAFPLSLLRRTSLSPGLTVSCIPQGSTHRKSRGSAPKRSRIPPPAVSAKAPSEMTPSSNVHSWAWV